MYFCIHDKLAIRTVIDGLRIPSLETRVRRLTTFLLYLLKSFLGYHSRHVLRFIEYQTSRMASSLHSGEAVDQYVSHNFVDSNTSLRLSLFPVYRKSQNLGDPNKPPDNKTHENTAKTQAEDSLKLTDQYIALLILVFHKAGLIDVRF